MTTLVVIGVAALIGVLYAGSVAFWPFAACWCCKGDGRHRRGDRKVWRRCRWCRGSGERLRIGRRLWNRIRSVHHDATR